MPPSTSASLNVLTLNDHRRIDNRISVLHGPDRAPRRSPLPRAWATPTASGRACALDNAKAGETTAQQASCASGYIGAIVGDLGRGSDTFDADPGLTGDDRRPDRRPGPAAGGRPRAGIGWWAGPWRDLLEGGGGADSTGRRGREDLHDRRAGRGQPERRRRSDCLLGGGGPDKLSGGAGRDLCKGGGRVGHRQELRDRLAGFRRYEGVMRGRAARRDPLVSPSHPFYGEAGL